MSESSAQLQAALAIPERIPQRHFAQLLRRCAIALRNRNESPYSEDEIQMLIEQFEMSPTDLDSMFSCCFYILQQAACFSFDLSTPLRCRRSSRCFPCRIRCVPR